MSTIHPYRLRPYHNPQGIDESKVPPGWRFLYADEAGKKQSKPCLPWFYSGLDLSSCHDGDRLDITYIVPVDA